MKLVQYVCNSTYNNINKDDPDYAIEEYDIYSHTFDIKKNHRLTIRYNLTNNEYELWKYQNNVKITPIQISNFKDKAIIGFNVEGSHTLNGKVIYKAPIFSDILNQASYLYNIEFERYRHTIDIQECCHKYPKKAQHCIKYKVEVDTIV